MPNLASFHPQVVHFVVALGLLGALFRIVSLLGKGAWLNPAAAILLIFAAGAGVVAVKSGTDAHGIAERIPGAREAVQEHEEAGHLARNVLLGVAGIELLGLLLASTRAAKAFRILGALAAIAGGVTIYEAAEHGGELVYNYAGGVGTRSGNPADVTSLLVAGLYHSARVARDSGRKEDAARFTEELERVRPDDPIVRFLAIESKLRDRGDPNGALTDLAAMQIPPDDARLASRHGLLTAQALVAAGKSDSAKVVLTALAAKFPQSQAIKAALDKLK